MDIDPDPNLPILTIESNPQVYDGTKKFSLRIFMNFLEFCRQLKELQS